MWVLGCPTLLLTSLAYQKYTGSRAEPGGGRGNTEVHRTLSLPSRNLCSSQRDGHTNSYCSYKDFPVV